MLLNKDKLTRLHDDIRQCVECPLHRNRRHAVPGEGDPHASILFIGEAPGKTEDEQGRPFVGPAGKFLDRLLKDHDLTREAVFLTSSVKCRPPNNRAPHPRELEICKRLWLDRQIALIDPVIVVLLGKILITQVLNERSNLKESHGQMHERNGRWYQLQCHPAAGRRFPDIRLSMRRDMAKLKRFLETPS
jgi:uracil-DNA glycosylase